MPGRTRKEIDKAHKLNKQVRREKARLRKREPKRAKVEKMYTMNIPFGELAEKTQAYIIAYAQKHNCSIQKAGQRVVEAALRQAMTINKLKGIKNGN